MILTALITTTPNFFYVQKSCGQLKEYPEGLSGKVTIKIFDVDEKSCEFSPLWNTKKILLKRRFKASENFKYLHDNYLEQMHAPKEVIQKMVSDHFAVDISYFQDKLVQITTRIYDLSIREKPYEANKSEEQQSAADVNPEKYSKLFASIVRIDQTTNIYSGIFKSGPKIHLNNYFICVKNKETYLLSGISYEVFHKEIFGKK